MLENRATEEPTTVANCYVSLLFGTAYPSLPTPSALSTSRIFRLAALPDRIGQTVNRQVELMRVSNREELIAPVRHVAFLESSLRFVDSHAIPDS